ncbi:hypothetical protein [Streptomyces chattanoogensis]|uniref:hypothetical protein n=1 Tax=Streptomyces chattanoogensis TaxID=66876 RepID=UPI001FE024BF|nr:hypothetical protein [Streptomyces chattanoogensis]
MVRWAVSAAASEVLGGHLVAGLQPLHPAHARVVQEDTPADDSVSPRRGAVIR